MTTQNAEQEADALVIFGITGDLAQKMTFRSLYRLERRGLLNQPVIGVAVDDWNVEQLADRARESINGTGEDLDEAIFKRFVKRLRYVSGDFGDDDTYKRLKQQLGELGNATFYLEVPPSLFGRVVAGLHGVGLLSSGQRVVVEKPFGHDLASARALAADLHQYLDESQLYRIDHFLGKMGLQEVLYLRFANLTLEPVWNRNYVSSVQVTMSEAVGVEDRGHFYDPVGALRDVVVNHLLQVVAAVAMEPPAGGDADTLKTAKYSVLRSMADADPAHYVRGQYEGYREIPGCVKDSSTETFAALRLDIDNWRWSGVPFFIRTGKRMPSKQTEVRLVFKRPPKLAFIPSGSRHPEPSQIVIKIDPSTGIQMILDAQRADRKGASDIHLDMEFAQEGGEAATPYEVLLHAALVGDATAFTRQDSVEESWRVVQPLLESPPKVVTYAPDTWGPTQAENLLKGYGGWRKPWILPEAPKGQRTE
ncbi:MAG TPA: glucose-6-phosphate dehydrogenase [Solirubrobacteraceae bacterium]|nr:glucose-6-phosphate dehydrogenase [Solirubrobacteraceae bacterium]